MPKKLETFEVKDGQEVFKLALLQIDADIGRQAQAVYNKTFSSAVRSDALLRSSLNKHMEDQGIWTKVMEEKHKKLADRINDNTEKLARGGIKLADARQIALDTRDARNEIRELIAERSSLDTNTAEGQAENARFNFLVSAVTVNDNTGEKFFNDLDDYLARSATEPAVEAATKLGQIMYGLDPGYMKTLPENKFLIKWKFAAFSDEAVRLINEDGHLVDDEGRLIDKEGFYIDADGNRVDRDGNPVTEDGELDVECAPFLDDEGQPIPDPEATLPAEENFGGAELPKAQPLDPQEENKNE
jgi:hypothetical protein